MDELTISSDSPFAGKVVSDMEVRGKDSFLVVALRKPDGTMIIHPQHEMVLAAGDTVIFDGTSR
ncbi:TrkA C-terminal domain-containing protein [Chroococcidiopsis sp. FACHB-1243]|uniref:TrkA C-terminal domain-containing protein n=1 Tax=Chroococcidiopsis sp. [FACHB-1243] TaxID=2692781 RepID=UPI00177BBBE0|nr:TrkA C-terminal domain-containing protein [Chroococcidiopsis sp. [FACHB-1243]]MBD2308412.1 TrkA C-terminal domain-containing protein [Chroococcidiopsis sp. [FACHB-1243]]